jgi:hypothetical protein
VRIDEHGVNKVASRRILLAVTATPTTVLLGALLAAKLHLSLYAVACWAITILAVSSIQTSIDDHARRFGNIRKWDRVGVSSGFVRFHARAAGVSPSGALWLVRGLWSCVIAFWTFLVIFSAIAFAQSGPSSLHALVPSL